MDKGTKLNSQIILITTKGFIERASECFSQLQSSPEIKENPWNEVIEVDEHIDMNGNIDLPLTENEINEILRKVFRVKQAVIFICLQHSGENTGKSADYSRL
jgi:N-methylhydantoinase A/oxoprolinase/acetone carboxylase beta subunit